jgi:hypothetical protein
LLSATVLCYGFQVLMVRPDAAYFTTLIMRFIRIVLGASFVIDCNLRRKGKKAVATRFLTTSGAFTNAFAPSLNATSPGLNVISA